MTDTQLPMNSNGHSIFSPSKAHRYLRCPGSIALEETQPDTTSIYAQEGTAAHELAEMLLTGQIKNAEEMLDRFIKWTEGGEEVAIPVGEEMCEYVTAYCDKVLERVEEFKMLPNVTDVVLHVEQRIDLSDVIGLPEQSGTADIVIEIQFDDNTVMLSVEDLKYGRGVEVSAVENEQLATYACGVMADYEFVGTPIRKVITVIHQIRKHHFSEYEYSYEDLCKFRTDLRLQAANAQHQRHRLAQGTPYKELLLTPGEKQCRFCKAKNICPAARDEVAKAVFNATEPVTDDEFAEFDETLPQETLAKEGGEGLVPPNDWLAACMTKIDFIEEWCRAIRAATNAAILDGENVPGYKLVQGRMGNRQWSDVEEVEDMLKSMRLKQDEMYSMKIISPTQAEKVLKGSPRRWKKLEDLIIRKEGKPAVVPESDKRPALDVRPVTDDEFDEFEDIA